MSHAHVSGRRARTSLAVVVALALALVAAAPASASVASLLGSFTTASFSDFNGGENISNATLSVVGNRAYDGSQSAYANYAGGGVNAYARVIQNVDWNAGDDVWYGSAYYLPVGFKAAMQQEVALQRWDNWSAYGSDADHGGIVIWRSDKLARLKVGKYSATTETMLTNGFALPEGRWFWLEVHQRFSATGGSALNEVYLDGALVGRSTTANFNRPVQKLRTGLVAQGGTAQTNPLTLWFDRVSIGTKALGPSGEPAPAPQPEPEPQPAPKPPAVMILSPAAGTTFGDWLGMSASVIDDTGIAKVEFLIDGEVVATRTGTPWSYTHDARALTSGWHTVTIRATDVDTLTSEASVQVNHHVPKQNSRKARLAGSATSETHIRMNVKVRRASHAKHKRALRRAAHQRRVAHRRAVRIRRAERRRAARHAGAQQIHRSTVRERRHQARA